MIIQFHTPSGPVEIDPLTVTDAELAMLGLTRADIAGEIQKAQDEARAAELLATSPAVITQPEMWELLRIYGRRLGFHQ